MSRIILWGGLILGTLCGGCAGFVVGKVKHSIPNTQRYPFLAKRFRLPHHVPAQPGGLSLRFAMVHDVIHERFPVHGSKWYETRNDAILKRLENPAVKDIDQWPWLDDLAVGFDRLGRPAEAVPWLRKKFTQQQAAGVSEAEMYTTYANLGTMLIHAHMGKYLKGDAASEEPINEGLSLIRKSIEVNPNAHFGRERWQLSIAEFIKATAHDPTLMTRFDCLGNRLDGDVELILNREANWTDTGYGRPNRVDFTRRTAALDDAPEFFNDDVDLDDPNLWEELSPVREYITRVGAEQGWADVNVPSHREPVAFDEPVLGMIGMWRQGGGANPHFSLALGETMLRVGQRYIAWNAFERTSMLADRYSANPDLHKFLRDHCRNRQRAIEQSLSSATLDDSELVRKRKKEQQNSPPASGEQLRPAFEKELKVGLDYQSAYQAYEQQEINQQHSTYDKQFFAEFERVHSTLWTDVGLEETVLAVPREKIHAYGEADTQGLMYLGAGIGSVLTSALTQLIRWAKRHRAV